MSVYERVQHVMFPIDPTAPAQQQWIGEVADTCSTFCKSVGLEETADMANVSLVLQTAAEMLWGESGGKPSWSRLDVNKYMASLDTHFTPAAEVCEMAVHVLTVFYSWLVETKQMRRGKALRKIRQLLRHCRTGEHRAITNAKGSQALN
jgi:hypothetical protein